jgi:Pup amidohydrolase
MMTGFLLQHGGKMPRYVGIENEYLAFCKNRRNGNIVEVNVLGTEDPENRWQDLYFLTIPINTNPLSFAADQSRANCGIWLKNGGKVYRDIKTVEYSSPECLTVREIVLAERAGEYIIGRLHEHLEDEYDVYLLKRSATEFMRSTETWGSHENYTVAQSVFGQVAGLTHGLKSPMYAIVCAHMASRQVITGAGHVAFSDSSRNRLNFWVSPRMKFIESDLSMTTRTGPRPLINSRSESLMSGGMAGLSRLHLIAGDMNRSDWSMYLKAGTTKMVLLFLHCVAEETLQELRNRLPQYNAWASVARTGSRPFSSEGKEYFEGLIGIQRILWEALWKQKGILREESKEFESIMALWRDALDAISGDPKQEKIFSHRLDWLIKKRIVEERIGAEISNLEQYDSPKGMRDLAAINFSYGRIHHRDLYRDLIDSGYAEEMFEDEDVARFRFTPPAGRARTRVEAVEYLTAQGLRSRMSLFDWGALSLKTPHLQGDPVPVCFDERSLQELKLQIDAIGRGTGGHRG